MVKPTAQVLARGMKQPSDFTVIAFNEMPVRCYAECNKTFVETASLQEPRASGQEVPSAGAKSASTWQAPNNHPAHIQQSILFANENKVFFAG